MKKLINIIILLLCICTAAHAVVYGPAYKAPTDRGIYSTAEMAISASAEKPKVVFYSTSPVYLITTTRTNVQELNADGTVRVPYTTNAPQPRRGGGLDIDDDDEPIGGMVPIGDIPFGFLLIAALAMIILKILNDKMTEKKSDLLA